MIHVFFLNINHAFSDAQQKTVTPRVPGIIRTYCSTSVQDAKENNGWSPEDVENKRISLSIRWEESSTRCYN
jgi:hypothetical protein